MRSVSRVNLSYFKFSAVDFTSVRNQYCLKVYGFVFYPVGPKSIFIDIYYMYLIDLL